MRRLLERLVLILCWIFAVLYGVVWSSQNLPIVILIVSAAAFLICLLKSYAKGEKARKASRHNKRELRRIRQSR